MKKLHCEICPTGAHYLRAGEEAVPRFEGESLAALWRRVLRVAWADGASTETLAVMAAAKPIAEHDDVVAFDGIPPARRGWFSHMVPIWMGQELAE